MLCEIDLDQLDATATPTRTVTGDWNAPGLRLQPGHATADIALADGTLLILRGRARDGDTPLTAAQLAARHARAGAAFLDSLRGSFALALIECTTARVLLANDRMGTHGWCYRLDGARIAFATRADALGNADRIDPQALFAYLLYYMIPAPATVFRDVHRLPPAHCLRLDRTGVELRPYWQPLFQEPAHADFAALRDEFRQLLEQAVQREAQTGGQVGTFLSGGTDSSTVSGLLARSRSAPVHAYSIGFDADGYDEMAYARIAATHFGLEHRAYYLTPDDVRDSMPQVACHYDQPFGNSSAVPAYHCARIARADGIDTLLAGDGGDELFAGNARYARQRILGGYEQLPAALRQRVLEPLAASPRAARLPLIGKLASYVQQARVPLPERLHRYNLLMQLGPERVLSAAFRQRIDSAQPDRDQHAAYWQLPEAAPLNRLLAYEWKHTLADNDLPKVCGTAALAGITVAFPLLADELIDFSLRLPVAYKLKGLRLRWFFKEALREFLPAAIITKKKQGFGLPFGVWTLRHAALRHLAFDALDSFAGRNIVDAHFLEQLKTELLAAHPGYYGELVWILAMLEFWLRDHAPDYQLAR